MTAGALIDRGHGLSIIESFLSVDVRPVVDVEDLANLIQVLLETFGPCLHSDGLSANMAELVVEHWSHIGRDRVDIS